MVLKKQESRSVKIPFVFKHYEISDGGQVTSYVYKNPNLLKLSKMGKLRTVDLFIEDIDQYKRVLIHRLVYFCFVYVKKVLKKPLEQATWQEFTYMPIVSHKDGNLEDNYYKNLISHPSREDLSDWVINKFPEKIVKLIPKKTEKLIIGDDLILCKKLLIEGVSYEEISKKLSVKVSKQAVYNLNKDLNISKRRSTAYSVNTKTWARASQLKKRKWTNVQISKELNISESALSRFFNKKII